MVNDEQWLGRIFDKNRDSVISLLGDQNWKVCIYCYMTITYLLWWYEAILGTRTHTHTHAHTPTHTQPHTHTHSNALSLAHIYTHTHTHTHTRSLDYLIAFEREKVINRQGLIRRNGHSQTKAMNTLMVARNCNEIFHHMTRNMEVRGGGLTSLSG